MYKEDILIEIESEIDVRGTYCLKGKVIHVAIIAQLIGGICIVQLVEFILNI